MKAVSLFSGAGGMDIGFEAAGFTVAVAVDHDANCCSTLRKNRPGVPVLEGDIRAISSQQIMAAGGLRPMEADLLFGGPPCQSFSIPGNRMGLNDPRGMLVFEFVKKVREILPAAFVMENVPEMGNWHGGDVLRAIENALSETLVHDGATIQYGMTHHILNAAHFGAPQARRRLFIVGNRLGRTFKFPSATHGGAAPMPPLSTVWDAIGGLPPADEPSATAKRVSGTIENRIRNHGF